METLTRSTEKKENTVLQEPGGGGPHCSLFQEAEVRVGLDL